MTPLSAQLEATPSPKTTRAASAEPADEREMLLNLATDLQAWPARNVVFKRALERAARDLVRMAGKV